MRVGLSKQALTPTLLSTFDDSGKIGRLRHSNRNAINITPDSKDSTDSTAHKAPKKAVHDAAPLPFNEYDEEEDILRPPDSSDDEISPGDIRPSLFMKTKVESSRRETQSPQDDDFGPTRERETSGARNRSEIKQSSSQRTRREGREPAGNIPKKAKLEVSAGDKSEDVAIFSFTSSQGSRKTVPTYGSKAKKQGIRGSQSNGEVSPKATFRAPLPVDIASPRSSKKKFNLPEVDLGDVENEQNKIFKTYNMDDYGSDSSPQKVPKFKAVSDFTDLLEAEDDTPKLRLFDMGTPKHDIPELDDMSPMAPVVTFRPLESGDGTQSQVRIFQIPSIIEDILTESGPGSDPTLVTDYDSLNIGLQSPETIQSTCPMCGESIDAEFLNSFSNGVRMNIRTQAKFCHAHKQLSAKNEWATKGYPTIDWSSLDARIAEHHSFIKELLEGASSHSRRVLEENIESGKNRTLLQSVSSSNISLTPGYYGSRGLRAISESIMHEFSPLLRQIAVKDRLVSSRGVMNFVQTVLVPELAVRLIGEDLDIGVNEARTVMNESARLGDLLSEETEDVVILREGQHEADSTCT